MRIDVNGRIQFVNKTTNDALEIIFSRGCCDAFTGNFSTFLADLLDGKIDMKDDTTNGVYSGMKMKFLDTAEVNSAGNGTIIETSIDGTQGKMNVYDEGNIKRLEFKGEVSPTSTTEIYIAKVQSQIGALDLSTSPATQKIYDLGENQRDISLSPLAETDTNTNLKGIKLIPKDYKLVFIMSLDVYVNS